MEEETRPQRYNFGDEDTWEDDPFQARAQVQAQVTPQVPEAPPRTARRLRRRTFLLGISAAGIGLAAGGYGGYRLLSYFLRPNYFSLTGPLTTPNDIVIYSNGKLGDGWQDWSWAHHQLRSQAETFQSQPSMQITLDNWGAVYFHHGPLDLTNFGYLQFYVNGGSASDQKVYALFVNQSGAYTPKTLIGPYTEGGGISSNTWKLTRIPLSALEVSKLTITGVLLEDASGSHQSDISIADLRIIYSPDLSTPHIASGLAYDQATITLVFTKRMLPTDAQATRFYSISSADPSYSSPKAPLSAHYHAGGQSVSLLVPTPLQVGQKYLVTVGAVRDQFNVTLPNPSRINVTAQSLTLNIDAAQDHRPISPLIYGMALAPTAYLQDLRLPLNRWGGNQTSRYNWKLGNAFNAARDYEFRNGNYNHTSPADRQPSGVADQFIAANNAAGAETLLTIPNIGWVARDDQSNTRSTGVPQTGGPPLSPGGDAIDGYDPTNNQQITSVPSQARKNGALSDPPDLTDPTVAQDEWVYHLTRRFGPSGSGGVRYYAMDNEPDLWFAEHTDIRPAELSYEQMRDTFLDYATAVKHVDPTALVTGPVLSGWLGYFYSPLDRGSDNYHTKADHAAHNNQDFLPWWLSQIRAHDEQTGQRSLDVLDIHYYPSGGEYPDNTDPKINAQRIRAVRSLWDPTYTDASWINAKIQLIPRMKGWIQQYYPGLKLGITEWNFGSDQHISGALAAAEALAIFGREGVDLACYWAYPTQTSPTYAAWKLFTNFDNQGSSFGTTSVQAVSSNYDLISCYGALDHQSGELRVMVLNKSPVADLTPTLHLANIQAGTAQVYQVSDEKPQLTRLADVPVSGSTLVLTFPALSITLLRFLP